TISSLLRLQGRRLPPGESRHALEESERRVRSIALVHEILSRDTHDDVDFNDILPSLIRMAEDLGHDDRPLKVHCSGEAGRLQAAVATPLAVVITELLQNAAEHAFGDEPAGGRELVVRLYFERHGDRLHVVVRDNGVGLPPGFSVEATTSLGLSIVRGLIASQMGGTIAMRSDGGTVVELDIPVDVEVADLESL
ncbi:MAG: sensor histidine kinase, partial [Acidimicrobiales bacterium]